MALSFLDDPPAWDHPKTAEGIRHTKPKRPTTSRNVSFTTDTQSAKMYDDKHHDVLTYTILPDAGPQRSNWQHVDRRAQNVDPDIEPGLPARLSNQTASFAVYDESFALSLGSSPKLDTLLTDRRGRYFYSAGTWVPRLSTLFVTSDLIRDDDPAAISSAHKRAEITRLEIGSDERVVRDKVRCPERSYMAVGCAYYPARESPTVLLCAQGSLREPAGLIEMDIRRPHKTRMILNNFHGRPFNSPHDIVYNSADCCLYFTDPTYGFERGFRPKPRLPGGHIYRFDPESGDCRVVASGISRPGSLAISPDGCRLYISEIGEKFGGTYIYTYDIIYTISPSAPNFKISVIPGGSRGANGTYHTPTSSSDESATSHRTDTSKVTTPFSSPHGLAAAANLVERGKLSRTNSRSGSRSRQMSNHKQLSSLSLDLHSPTLGPTSNPIQSAHWTDRGSTARSTFLTNKRLFVYSPNPSPSGGIAIDPIYGNVWLGTEEGVETWSVKSGELIGKILVDEWDDATVGKVDTKGVSRVVFLDGKRAVLLGGERMWILHMNS